MENLMPVLEFLKNRILIEAIHNQYYLVWLVDDFGIFAKLRDPKISLHLKELLEIRKKSVKLIRYLLDSGLFYMVDLADFEDNKTPEEIIEKIESLWSKPGLKNHLPNYTIIFDLTPKGIEYARSLFPKLLKMEEKLVLKAFEEKYILLKDLVDLVKKEFSIEDTERLKYYSNLFLFETNLEIGTLKNKEFEKFDLDEYRPEIDFLNKWEKLSIKKDFYKKFILRNLKETNELIEEWQKKGGELFSKAYKWLDFSLEKAKKRWEKYGK